MLCLLSLIKKPSDCGDYSAINLSYLSLSHYAIISTICALTIDFYLHPSLTLALFGGKTTGEIQIIYHLQIHTPSSYLLSKWTVILPGVHSDVLKSKLALSSLSSSYIHEANSSINHRILSSSHDSARMKFHKSLTASKRWFASQVIVKS